MLSQRKQSKDGLYVMVLIVEYSRYAIVENIKSLTTDNIIGRLKKIFCEIGSSEKRQRSAIEQRSVHGNIIKRGSGGGGFSCGTEPNEQFKSADVNSKALAETYANNRRHTKNHDIETGAIR